MKLAKLNVIEEQFKYQPLSEALVYFIESWDDVLHPALVSLACEAVGGKPEATTQIGAALVLLAGGADIHDDIIDQTYSKGSEQTVLGKFGSDIAILAGDALLLEGIYLLHEGGEMLCGMKKRLIIEVIKQTFFEICSAEAAEANMRGRIDIRRREYLEIIRQKVSAGEAAARIGAVIGEGTPEEIEILADFGRTFGYLFTLRDEFIDIYEQDELTNRVEKECLPLPILATMEDETKKSILLDLLSGNITEDKIEKIVDIVTYSNGTQSLVSDMKLLVGQKITKLSALRFCRHEFALLLEATLEDL